MQDNMQILMLQATEEYQNGKYLDALYKFIKIYNENGDKEILQAMKELYYEPDKEYLHRQYEKNLRLISEYPRCFSDKVNAYQEICILWYDENEIIYVDESNRICRRRRKDFSGTSMQESIVLLAGELWDRNYEKIARKTRLKKPFLDYEVPLYAAYGEWEWNMFLMLSECLLELLEQDRVIFLIGKEVCCQYFKRPMVRLPELILGEAVLTYQKIGERVLKERLKQEEDDISFIRNYYKEHARDVKNHIRSGKPTILSIVSRFTTAIQYHTKDCMEAAGALGCKACVLIEEDRFQVAENRDYVSYIRKYLPDIIFSIDFFRFHFKGILPKEVFFVCWIQDPLEDILDKETPKRLGENDFVMSHYNNWKEIDDLQYGKYTNFMEAPIPASDEKYKRYQVSDAEREKYASEICFVCHAADLDKELSEINELVADAKIQEFICFLVRDYYSFVYETGDFLYSRKQLEEYVYKAMRKFFGKDIVLDTQCIEALADILIININQVIYRNVLVDWLIDAGYTNIKLWGNGWQNHKKYGSYAMGPAQNGEVLSKIYQCSRINVGNNIMTSAAARAWECMLSGGFYLCNYIPPEEDTVNIRKILTLDEDVACFYNKKDFLYKVSYYLAHEEERQKMIERGREAALERMTYKKLMKKLLDEMKSKLE